MGIRCSSLPLPTASSCIMCRLFPDRMCFTKDNKVEIEVEIVDVSRTLILHAIC